MAKHKTKKSMKKSKAKLKSKKNKIKVPFSAEQKALLVVIGFALVLLLSGLAYFSNQPYRAEEQLSPQEILKAAEEARTKALQDYNTNNSNFGLKVYNLGYDYPEFLGNEEGYKENEIVDYRTASKQKGGKVYLNGQWEIGKDYVRYADEPKPDGYVSVVIYGRKFQAEISTSDKLLSEAEVLVNGKPLIDEIAGKDAVVVAGKSYIKIDRVGAYNILNIEQPGLHEIRILPKKDNFVIHKIRFS